MLMKYSVSVRQVGGPAVEAVSRNGGRVVMAPPERSGSFTPVELLLAALGGCAAIDVAQLLAEDGHAPDRLELQASGRRPVDQQWLTDASLRYSVSTAGADVERAIAVAGAELCTVALTLEHGCAVRHELVEGPWTRD